MLKRKGIIGVGVVMSAMLGILLLGLAVGVTSPGGSLFESVSEGLGLVDEQVSSTIVIEGNEQEAKETFSDAAKYVYHRASNNGCGSGGPVEQQNKEGGYAGLEGTHLSVKPPCAGSSGTFAASAKNAVGGDSGNDMEGVFSRVKFEISDEREEPLIFTKDGGTWIENNYLAASKEGFYEKIRNQCHSYTDTEEYFGTDSTYNFFFKSEGSNARANIWMEDKGIEENVYCREPGFDWTSYTNEKFSGEDVDIALCPGDKGYIQMNKGDKTGKGPNNKGEASKGLNDGETYFPFVQITETGDCQAGLYEDNLEFEVTQDPKMVEDQLGLRMEGLFEYDDKVRFDFVKNGETVHQEKVDVEGGVATAELTPGNNGMNVGSYTVVPNILRCDDNGESCESPNVDITTSFEIENYMYNVDYVPEERGLRGSNEITVSINNENDYSSTEPMTVRGFDYTVDANIEFGALQDGASNQCDFIVEDKDAVNDDHAVVFFRRGGIIQKEGSLPSREGISQDSTGGGPGDDSPWTIYDNLVLNDREWKEHDTWISPGPRHTLLVDSNTGKSFKLHGDLLCAENYVESVSWILCDESNVPEGSEFGEDYTIETNGREYLCEPDEGEWSKTGANIPDVISGVVTTDITEEMTENPDVVEESDSSITFRPAESDENDYLIWESLPEGDKLIEITVNFEERGHLRVEAQARAGLDSEIINYLYTEVYGDETVYFYGSSDYDYTGFDYSIGEEYKIIIERSGSETTWTIEQGGNTEWSQSGETSDFRRLALGSWETYNSNQAQSPVVTIKNLEIEDR